MATIVLSGQLCHGLELNTECLDGFQNNGYEGILSKVHAAVKAIYVGSAKPR